MTRSRPALAAGETPSPELVAASGSSDRWPHARAWLIAASVLVFAVMASLFASNRSLLAHAQPEKSLAVLNDRAMDLIHSLGHTQPLPFTVSRYETRDAFLRRPAAPDGSRQIDRRPSPFWFWLRGAPSALEPTNAELVLTELDPFPARPGEIYLRTDTRGRLERFIAVPPRGRASAPSEPVDPNIAFALAELDLSRFEPIPSTRRPPISVDHLSAYRGSLAEFPNEPIVVHVGSVDSKLAYFTAEFPWDAPAPTSVAALPPTPLGFTLGSLGGVVVFTAACVVMVVRNIKQGRADRAGAMRAAVAMFFIASLSEFVRADVAPSASVVFFDGGILGIPLWAGMMLWFFYMAFEPAARRLLPGSLVSWSRLLRGGFSDPLIGRHVLIGLATGALASLLAAAGLWASHLGDHDAHALFTTGGTRTLVEGPGRVLSRVLGSIIMATMRSNGSILVVTMGLAISRRRWVGFVAMGVVAFLLTINSFRNNWVDSSIELAIMVGLAWYLLPIGLVACIAGYFGVAIVNTLLLGFNFTGPIGSLAWIPAAALALLTAGAALSATMGRPAMTR